MNFNFSDLYKRINDIDKGVVAECGDMSPPLSGDSPLMGEIAGMGAPKQQDNVTINVSMNGSGAGGIRDLMNVLKDIQDGPDDGGSDTSDNVDKLFGDEGEDVEVAFGEEQVDDGGFGSATTEPSEEVAPMAAVTPTGDDMHSKGKEAEKVNGGGNPFNVDEGLLSQLANLYQEVKLR